ncbi:HD domain-containing protein [Sediminitomix flava]|uniref:HD domain-containing protein n=1 Tax=Sediminitomix flava TaxID=379075 RepID=A0A315ZWC3_SEDFL|nr:hypothetical protein [Sediminitomix flava]PWJ40993.1 hypothetical protein BC781_104259 [Sediminitomix flava]
MQKLLLPDTNLVNEANEIVSQALTKNVYNHSLRTYFLGNKYAKSKSISYDDEELALVALFHDIGFHELYADANRAFQVSSSLAIKDYLSVMGVEKGRVNVMMEAIDFHMQLLPRWDKSEVAGLLQVGAHMDVLGTRKFAVQKDDRKAISNAFPKGGFVLEFGTCLCKSMKSLNAVTGLFAPLTCQAKDHYYDLEKEEVIL